MTFAIATPDTLSAIGLRHILHSYFDIEALIYPSATRLLAAHPERFDGYFVTPDIYLGCSDLLLPRKSRVVVLTAPPLPEASGIHSIEIGLGETELIEAVDHCITAINKSHNETASREELTPRETDVLQGIAQGLLNKEIADRLHISINTVLTHRKNITAKLGIKTVSGLSLYAMMNGLIPTGE